MRANNLICSENFNLHNFARAKREIAETGKHLYEKGFAPGASGNISIKLENNILITPSGFNLGEVEESDVVILDIEGKKVNGKRNPSSESQMHVEIYKNRPDFKSIIHAHTPKATSFAVAGIPLDKALLSESVVIIGTVPIAEYAMPSSDELAKIVAGYFNDHNVVLMANHGVVTGGQKLKEIYYKLETLEFYAEVFLWTNVLGKMSELSEENVKELITKYGRSM
ncbi:MAG: class II aldolase/adducin family protein [Candidatus Gastranaerophilales bacterium]|nr:class II aldolase/adducin family protein [Candidatus Gastranaerophilales bacterium]